MPVNNARIANTAEMLWSAPKNHKRELRQNIEVRCDTIARALIEMKEEGRLVRRRKGKQRVLWGLARAEIRE